PFLTEPAGARPVYVTTAGVIDEIRVAPGDRVDQGQVLAVLSNPELEDEIRQLEAERATEAARAVAFAQSRDQARRHAAVQRIAGLEKRIAEARHRLEELTITADQAGSVVAPP